MSHLHGTVDLQSSQTMALMIRAFVYILAATKTVVVIMHPTIVKMRYGCNENGSEKVGRTLGGGVKPG